MKNKTVKRSSAYKKGIADGKKFEKLLKHYGKENEWTDILKHNPFSVIKGSFFNMKHHVDWKKGFIHETKTTPYGSRKVNCFNDVNIDDEIQYSEYIISSEKTKLKELKEKKKKFIYDILKRK